MYRENLSTTLIPNETFHCNANAHMKDQNPLHQFMVCSFWPNITHIKEINIFTYVLNSYLRHVTYSIQQVMPASFHQQLLVDSGESYDHCIPSFCVHPDSSEEPMADRLLFSTNSSNIWDISCCEQIILLTRPLKIKHAFLWWQ